MTLPVDGLNGAPEVGGVDENNLVAWCKMGDRFRLTATAEFSGYDTAPQPVGFHRHAPDGAGALPAGRRLRAPSYWACLRPMTPEGTPIFGRGRHRNLWINTGQGHMGWTMACGSARITADLMAGRKPEIDTAGHDLRARLRTTRHAGRASKPTFSSTAATSRSRSTTASPTGPRSD